MSPNDPVGGQPVWASPPMPYAAPDAPAQGVPGWIPITALVLSGISVVGLVLLAVALLALGAFDAGGTAPLTGQAPVAAGAVNGSGLSAEVQDVVEQDGGTVTAIRCPDTAAVRQGTVTVCHGTIDDERWALVVFFEDARGSFTVLPA